MFNVTTKFSNNFFCVALKNELYKIQLNILTFFHFMNQQDKVCDPFGIARILELITHKTLWAITHSPGWKNKVCEPLC